MVFVLHSVCGCGGLIQLALTSSRFEQVAVAILVVHSSACPVVLCPLSDLVVLPTLHSPVADSLPFLFFLMYCLSYFFFFHCVSSLFVLCCRVSVLMRPSGRPWHVGSCWTVLLALFSTLSLFGLVPRQLVPSVFQNDRHSVACTCLLRSWDPPAFRLRHCLSLRDCH